MARILIVGYGNPLKSDDGLGWRAAEQLAQQLSSPEIKVIRLHQLTPEIAEEASRAELVIFIDARQEGPPGEMNCELVSGQRTSPPTYSHALSPGSILGLSGELYGHSPRAYLLTVAGQCFEDGESLSEAVRATLPRIVAQVKALIS